MEAYALRIVALTSIVDFGSVYLIAFSCDLSSGYPPSNERLYSNYGHHVSLHNLFFAHPVVYGTGCYLFGVLLVLIVSTAICLTHFYFFGNLNSNSLT